MENKIRGFEFVSQEHIKNWGDISTKIVANLPTRGSKTSAGYDFYSPIDVKIPAGEQVLIWSDVKAYMQEGEVLMIHVRSSIGIKAGLMLANTTGVIDADYYSNESNDGNIGICLKNTGDREVRIAAGERIAQGVFMPFLVADNGNTDEERTGGIGSTNK